VGALTGNVTGTASGNAVLTGSTNNTLVTVTGANAITGESTLTYDGTNLDLNADNKKLRLGGGNDIELYTDGSHSYLNNENGNWYIHGSTGSNSQEILIRPKQGEQSIRAIADGAVELYYDNSKRIETHTQGAAIASGSMTMPAMNSFSSQILVGASGFIGNYHDGTTNQQLIVGTNQYFDSVYKSRTNTTAAQIQFFERTFRFNTAAAPGSAGGTLTQEQALRIDTDGVKFGTDTAAANALADYEQGSWTATVSYGSGGYLSANNVVCRYVKVGNLVQISGRFSLTGGGAGDLAIGGLPYAKGNPSGDGNSAGIQIYIEGAASSISSSIVGLVLDANTVILVRRGGTTSSGADVAGLVDGGTTFLIGGTYTTSG
jgi:hypothetical protein